MERAKAAHEPCWYGVRKGASGQWIGDRKQTTAWEIEHDETAEGGHGTQKPVACMAIPITNHAGDVYDPFLGSGTTLVAAEQLGRRGYGMELEPRYVAIALERLERLGVVGAQAA
jgi:DNA modification methylase